MWHFVYPFLKCQVSFEWPLMSLKAIPIGNVLDLNQQKVIIVIKRYSLSRFCCYQEVVESVSYLVDHLKSGGLGEQKNECHLCLLFKTMEFYKRGTKDSLESFCSQSYKTFFFANKEFFHFFCESRSFYYQWIFLFM